MLIFQVKLKDEEEAEYINDSTYESQKFIAKQWIDENVSAVHLWYRGKCIDTWIPGERPLSNNQCKKLAIEKHL